MLDDQPPCLMIDEPSKCPGSKLAERYAYPAICAVIRPVRRHPISAVRR